MQFSGAFRITVNLSSYFDDSRSRSRIFVDENIKTIKNLMTVIKKVFQIRNFHLVSQDEYLPPPVDIRVLQPDEIIVVKPGKHPYGKLAGKKTSKRKWNVVVEETEERDEELLSEQRKSVHVEEEIKHIEPQNILGDRDEPKKKKAKHASNKNRSNTDVSSNEHTATESSVSSKDLSKKNTVGSITTKSNLAEKISNPFVEGKPTNISTSKPKDLSANKIILKEDSNSKDYVCKGNLAFYTKNIPVSTITDQYLKQKKVNVVKIDVVQNSTKPNSSCDEHSETDTKKADVKQTNSMEYLINACSNHLDSVNSNCLYKSNNSVANSESPLITNQSDTKTAEVNSSDNEKNTSVLHVEKKIVFKKPRIVYHSLSPISPLTPNSPKIAENTSDLTRMQKYFYYNSPKMAQISNKDCLAPDKKIVNLSKSTNVDPLPAVNGTGKNEVLQKSEVPETNSSQLSEKNDVQETGQQDVTENCEVNESVNIQKAPVLNSSFNENSEKLREKLRMFMSMPAIISRTNTNKNKLNSDPNSSPKSDPAPSSNEIECNSALRPSEISPGPNLHSTPVSEITGNENKWNSETSGCQEFDPIPVSKFSGVENESNSVLSPIEISGCQKLNATVESEINGSDNDWSLVRSTINISDCQEPSPRVRKLSGKELGVGSLLEKLRNSYSSQSSQDTSLNCNTENVTKRKRVRTRKHKKRSKQLSDSTLDTPQLIYKPPNVKTRPMMHLKFNDDLDDSVQILSTTENSEKNTDESMTITVESDEENKMKEYIYKAPLMKDLEPKVGDVIAFKALKMSDDYSPTISPHIIGKVLDVQNQQVVFAVLSGVQHCKIPSGKLTVPQDDSPGIKRVYQFNELIEPRLLYP